MAGRRLRLRRPRGTAELLAAAVVALAAMVLITKTITAALDMFVHIWPAVAALAALAGIGALWWALRSATARRRAAERLTRLRLSLAEFDAMDDREFEHALRDLLIRDGWLAQRVGQGGDQAADVIGRHGQYGRIVVQAKHTRVGSKVRSSVMYQVNGTAGPTHGAHHAVVVTNGAFTRDAMAWGDRHRVRWVDRDRLRRWAEDGIALQELLCLSGKSRRLPGRRTAV